MMRTITPPSHMNSSRSREVLHKKSINKRQGEITDRAITVISEFLYDNLMRKSPLPSRFFTMTSPYIAARWLEIEPYGHRGESHGQHQSSFGEASRAYRIAPRQHRRCQAAYCAERGSTDRRHEPRADRARRLPVLGDVPGRSRHRCGITPRSTVGEEIPSWAKLLPSRARPTRGHGGISS